VAELDHGVGGIVGPNVDPIFYLVNLILNSKGNLEHVLTNILGMDKDDLLPTALKAQGVSR